MRRTFRSLLLSALVIGVALASGCTKPALRDKPPPDPLLSSGKKPVEGRAHLNDARRLPDDEYAPPPRPLDEARPVRLLNVRPGVKD